MASHLDTSLVATDANIAPLKTKRGREFLEYQDYLFNLEKSTILKNRNIKQYWKCVHRKCPARMHVTLIDGSADQKVLEGDPRHDPTFCQPRRDEITQRAVRQEIIDLVEQGSLSLNEAYDEVKTKFMEICPDATAILPTKKSLQSVCTRRKSGAKRHEDENDVSLDGLSETAPAKRPHLEARLRQNQTLSIGSTPQGYQLQGHGSSSTADGSSLEISNSMPNWLIKSVDAAIANATKPLLDRVRLLEQRVATLETQTHAETTASGNGGGEKRHKFSSAAK